MMPIPPHFVQIDVLRGVAVLAVLLYHFSWFPHGYLGVNLFFVISGFLVVQPMFGTDRVSAPKFLLRRAAKILPSYYLFLILSILLWDRFAPIDSRPELTIGNWAKYFIFYANYRGMGPWSLAHTWSLCAEMHFYFLLPLGYLFFRKVFPAQNAIVWIAGCFIVGSAVLRHVGYFRHFETIAATHNRLDAFGYGILLAWISSCGLLARFASARRWWFTAGGTCLGILTAVYRPEGNYFFKVWYHSIATLSLAAIAAAILDVKWKFPGFSFFAKYSYNLYLWHPLLKNFILTSLGNGWVGLAAFLSSSLVVAMACTHLVEEPGTRWLRRRLYSEPSAGEFPRPRVSRLEIKEAA